MPSRPRTEVDPASSAWRTTPYLTLALAAVILLLSLGVGLNVPRHLSAGGMDDPGSEAQETTRLLAKEFTAGDPDILLLITARHTKVSDPAVAKKARALADRLRGERGVVSVQSHWDASASPTLRSDDGRQGIIAVRLSGDRNDKNDRVRELGREYAGVAGPVDVAIGGYGEVYREVQDVIKEDTIRLELFVVPISGILLLLVFRSIVAALLPLVIGSLSAAVTLLVLRVLASQTEVSIFALNLTSALALGLGIDYGLLMVTRFREELASGRLPEAAVRRTLSSAGRTVIFSGLIVASSLAALLVFPLVFLRSFAYAAIPVVLVSIIAAVVVLPAMLRLLGHNIDRWSSRRLPRLAPSEGTWHRHALRTMRWRAPILILGIPFLLILALPFLDVKIGKADDRTLPEDSTVRATQQQIRDNFQGNLSYPVSVLLPSKGNLSKDQAQVAEFAEQISSVRDVGTVQTSTGIYSAGRLVFSDPQLLGRFANDRSSYLLVALAPGVDAYSERAKHAVREIRDLGDDHRAMVGGETAALIDNNKAIGDRLPVAALIIVLSSGLLLFVMSGSVVIPVKALALNILSLTATFGAMVWIFQEGNLAEYLNFTATGMLEQAMPVLMFCTAFGLSMDYELFLISRIREQFLRGGDNEKAVAEGIQKTAGVITSAAFLLVVVFVGLSLSRVSLIKMMGVGVALAIAMDATLIRGALVPALMSAMGRANWWSPRFLQKIHGHIRFSESPEPAAIPESNPVGSGKS